jgi:hypothetical protein
MPSPAIAADDTVTSAAVKTAVFSKEIFLALNICSGQSLTAGRLFSAILVPKWDSRKISRALQEA